MVNGIGHFAIIDGEVSLCEFTWLVLFCLKEMKVELVMLILTLSIGYLIAMDLDVPPLIFAA